MRRPARIRTQYDDSVVMRHMANIGGSYYVMPPRRTASVGGQSRRYHTDDIIVRCVVCVRLYLDNSMVRNWTLYTRVHDMTVGPNYNCHEVFIEDGVGDGRLYCASEIPLLTLTSYSL